MFKNLYKLKSIKNGQYINLGPFNSTFVFFQIFFYILFTTFIVSCYPFF